MVVRPIPCPTCGYTLLGLPLDRACPECGLSIAEAIDRITDPTATALPRLRDPRGVGIALLFLTVSHLIATLGLIAPAVLTQFDTWRPGIESSSWLRWIAWSPLASTVIALPVLWSVWKLSRPRPIEGDAQVSLHLRLMAVGVIGFAIAAVGFFVLRRAEAITAPDVRSTSGILLSLLMGLTLGVTAAVHYFGLARIIRIIGQRSREYRTSKIGRQHVRDMVIVILVITTAEIVETLALGFNRPRLHAAATIIAWTSTLMLLIGQVYLLANAWWIRSAIARPIPHVRDLVQLVDAETPADFMNTITSYPEHGEGR